MGETEGMMGLSGGMGGGMFLMLGVLLLFVCAAILIVVLLRRAVAGVPAQMVRVGALDRLKVPASATVAPSEAPPSDEFEGFLVIPDITGYTQFMQMSAFALAHAQYAVSALLSSVIDAAEGVLGTIKIEGDAVLLYGVKAVEGGQQSVTGQQVGEVVGALLSAFYRKRAELSLVNACRCAACRYVDKLELKVVVHSGRLLLYDLRGQREISGLPVIVAHRLLKSDVGHERYVLITDEASQYVSLPFRTEPKDHLESYQGVGNVKSTVHAFTEASLLEESLQPGVGAPSMAGDTARKLIEGLRALRGPAGSG